MAYEIERKYLVINDDYRKMAERRSEISQGYLCREPERTVRVRILGDHGFITVKGITEHAVRREYEYEIPLDDAREMLGMCTGRVVSKIRWYVPYGGFIWEVDEFQGDLAPLVVAEIELPAADTPHDLPPFIGREVTGNPQFYNSML